MESVFVVEDSVIYSLAAGPGEVAFADELRNRPGFFGSGDCKGADRDHWRRSRTAHRAFLGWSWQICIRRAETGNVFGARHAGRFRGPDKDCRFAGRRFAATQSYHRQSGSEHLSFRKE